VDVCTILCGARALAPDDHRRLVLVTTCIQRRILVVEMNARRIGSGNAARLERYDRILGLSYEE
jgi:hypothetical protein